MRNKKVKYVCTCHSPKYCYQTGGLSVENAERCSMILAMNI